MNAQENQGKLAMQPMENQGINTRQAARYGFAVVCLAAATVLRGTLASVLGPAAVPFITYFPAVVLTSWYGGLGPGLMVTGVAALIAQYFFMEPVGTFQIRNAGDGVALLIFTASSVLIVWLNEIREREHRKVLTAAAGSSQQVQILEERIRVMNDAEHTALEYKRWAGDTLSSIGDGVICTDVDGCVTFLNAAAERLTGWPLAEARGKDIADVFVIINEYTRKPASNPIRRVLEEGTLMGLANHTLLVSRDGREISIDDSGAPIRGPKDKQITGAVLVFRDMAERKALEDELRRTAKNLENTNRELAAFAYTIGHDLQEPLRNMTAFSQLLLRHCASIGVDDKRARECLDFISGGGKRMDAMIRDLLAYSNAVNASNGVFSEVRLRDAVSWATQNLLERIRENDAEVLTEDLPTVSADHVQLVQLFQNLIGNAVKYRGQERPQVRISAVPTPTHWHISVADNGRGFDPADQKVIFDLFRRGVGIDQATTGSGIGLAICKRIVERHGGAIWAETSPGQGSTFHFTLARRTPPDFE